MTVACVEAVGAQAKGCRVMPLGEKFCDPLDGIEALQRELSR